MQKLYSDKEAAEILGVSVYTIRKWIKLNKLDSVKIHGARRIRAETIDALIAEGSPKEG